MLLQKIKVRAKATLSKQWDKFPSLYIKGKALEHIPTPCWCECLVGAKRVLPSSPHSWNAHITTKWIHNAYRKTFSDVRSRQLNCVFDTRHLPSFVYILFFIGGSITGDIQKNQAHCHHHVKTIYRDEEMKLMLK